MEDERVVLGRAMRPWRKSDFKASQNALILSSKLWGSPENLKRQLLAPAPEIPDGLGLRGLRILMGIAKLSLESGHKIRLPNALDEVTIEARGQRFSFLEARYEIVRRAIESIEGE